MQHRGCDVSFQHATKSTSNKFCIVEFDADAHRDRLVLAPNARGSEI